MKKLLLKVVIGVLVICMLLPSVIGCKRDNSEEGETTSEPTVDKGAVVDIIKDGTSQYTIVYNYNDGLGKAMAQEFADTLYNLYKVTLPIRPDNQEFEKEILIGNTVRGESVEAMMKIAVDEPDFYIGNSGNKIVMCAGTVNSYKRMFITFETIFCDIENQTAFIWENESYHLIEIPEDERVDKGESLSVVDGGKTQFSIIYPNDSFEDRMLAKYLSKGFKTHTGVAVSTYDEYEEYSDNMDYEIVVGSIKVPGRDDAKSVKYLLNKNSTDFVITKSGNRIYILGGNLEGLVLGIEYFVDTFLKNSNGDVDFYDCDEYRHIMSGANYIISDELRADIYKNVLHKHSSMYEFYLQTEVSSAGLSDQKKIDAMVERLGDSAVFYIGSSSVIYKGFMKKLDTSDYSRVATADNTTVKIPAQFANQYFGVDYSLEENVDLIALAEAKGMNYYMGSNLVIISPKDVAPFADDSKVNNGYTNKEFKNRMIEFFISEEFPEPNNNTEQSRVVIDDAGEYPSNAVDYTTQEYICLYSPNILNVKTSDGNIIYVSYEYCKVVCGVEKQTETHIRTSSDGGKTWKEFAVIENLKFADFFEINGQVYLIGYYQGSPAGMSVFKLNADGSFKRSSWPAELGLSNIFQHAIIDGVLYIPLDKKIASLPIDKDPMIYDNWTLTTNNVEELLNFEWFNAYSGLSKVGEFPPIEGGIIQMPDGTVCGIYRLECHPHPERVGLVALSSDRTKLSYYKNPSESLLIMPTSISRFGIQYDKETECYVLISNWYTVEEPNSLSRARTVLGISVSKDMKTWVQLDTLLVERELMNAECSAWKHAYQYPDWAFDGDDIIMAVREASGDRVSNFHDGTYTTFYRVENFRDMIPEYMLPNF